METTKIIHWQDGNMWLGYLEEYPDYITRGETLDELKENLKDWDSYESIKWDKVINYGLGKDIIGTGILIKKVICKTGPGKSFPNDENGEMDKGDKVYIIDKSDVWYKIRVTPNDSLFMVNNKLVYWAAWVNGDYLKFVKSDKAIKYSVHHKYRSKNSFGGYVISDQIFTFDKEGNIIDVKNE